MTLAAATIPVDQDISSIATGEWPEREFPLGPRERPTRRCVIFKQSVLNDIRAHGRGSPDIEVCGVIVGNVYRDAMGPFVFVEASIRGNFSAGKNAQVTFTAATWSHIQDVMDRQYSDLRILGWYHTHPGHGIFLSDMDLFIHKNFFSLPWHLAFVFDPQHQEEGLFAWRMGNMAVESFVVQKDVAADATKVHRRMPDAAPQPITATPAELAAQTATTTAPAPNSAASAAQPALPHSALMELRDIATRLQSLEKRQRWMTAALALMMFIAVGWPLALAAFAVLNQSSIPQLPLLSQPAASGEFDGSPADEPEPASDSPSAPRTAAAQP